MVLAVQKTDDDLPADMSTVFSDTDITEALTSTMMATVTAMGATLTPTPVIPSGIIPVTSADGSRHNVGTVGSRIMS